ncbi:membrane protein A21 [Saimiriine betaherpesvirus 4]|uniref:Membrane protein A21 n=1 Tax=Saimiriine betaherpesvirus 4 TaxID=1535247 RepID=G8XT16_9BETA|nr:membrane protein A21 [Saimiriine betaherpesvirus 4]AEV80961.1 membrane protein A21 [Saimiriine betaherpesvirus 4]
MKTVMCGMLMVAGFAYQTCKPDEYTTSVGSCCPVCQSGYMATSECSEYTGTVCTPCRVCNGSGMTTIQNCSVTQNAICMCMDGYNCSKEVNNSCVECLRSLETSGSDINHDQNNDMSFSSLEIQYFAIPLILLMSLMILIIAVIFRYRNVLRLMILTYLDRSRFHP